MWIMNIILYLERHIKIVKGPLRWESGLLNKSKIIKSNRAGSFCFIPKAERIAPIVLRDTEFTFDH